jgi:hypothetical protein
MRRQGPEQSEGFWFEPAEPTVPKLSWTRFETALLIASALSVVVGMLVFAQGWRISPVWGRANLRAAVVLCGLYAVLTLSANAPRMINFPVRVTYANVARQARILRHLLLWGQLEAISLMVVILISNLGDARGQTSADWFIPAFLVIFVSLWITMGVNLWSAYRAR